MQEIVEVISKRTTVYYLTIGIPKGQEEGRSFLLHLCLFFFFLLSNLNLHTQCGASAHDTEIKSHVRYGLSQQGAPVSHVLTAKTLREKVKTLES